MTFPEHYRTEIVSAVESIDLEKIAEVIELFRKTRAQGGSIFVLGSGGTVAASKALCNMLAGSSFNRLTRFRILALDDQTPAVTAQVQGFCHERIFIEQLKNFAQPGDVVVGVNPSSDAMIRALEYAIWIGCRTVVFANAHCGAIGELADIVVRVGADAELSVEQAHAIICHMIGRYFLECDKS